MAHDDLVREIADELAALQAAYDDADRRLAERLGIGRTDLRCVDLVMRAGARTPGEIARRLGLAPGSVTALLTRLEHAGYLQRRPDPTHGRRQIVEVTPSLVAAVTPLVSARAERGRDALAGYTDRQLTTILGFLRETRARYGPVDSAAPAPTSAP